MPAVNFIWMTSL